MQRVQQHMVEGLPEVVSQLDEQDGKIGSLSDLNTTAKGNLVDAVNELFTFANDGKSKWSSVIGSPLVSSDTFTDMQTKTQTIKDTLATNLTAKGQSSAGTEPLTSLVNKVAGVNTGFKRATGTILLPPSPSSWSTAVVSGLGFKPKFIFLKGPDGSAFNLIYLDSYPNVGSLNYSWKPQNVSDNPSVNQVSTNTDGFSFQHAFNSASRLYSYLAYE